MKEKVSKKPFNSRVNSLLNPKKIQTTRAKLGLSCSDLAKKIDVSRQYLSGIETGRLTTNLERAEQIAKVLKVKVNEIFKKDENNHYACK